MILPRPLGGLSEVMDDYDGVILDLWGVVHDGYAPFPASTPALKHLRKAGKKIWLLSNAPRRVAVVAEQLQAMGVTPDLYDGILTSGEAVHHALKTHLLSEWGRRCLCLGDTSLLAGLDVTVATGPLAADFILANVVPGGGVAANRGLLELCAAQGLPMLCANPDRVVHVGDHLVVCPGALADAYAEMGQRVTFFGKPYPDVYTQVLDTMGTRRVLAVGDGMATDVKGAAGAGLDVALVTRGIHRDALFDAVAGPMEHPAKNRLVALMTAEGGKPSFVINGLSW